MDWKDIAVRTCKCGAPNMRRQVVSGNLQLFWCPRCGRLLKEVRDCGCCYQEVRDENGVSLGPKAMDHSKCDKVLKEEWLEPDSVTLLDGFQGIIGPDGKPRVDPETAMMARTILRLLEEEGPVQGVQGFVGSQGFEGGPQGHVDPDGVIRFGPPDLNEVAARLKQMDQKLQKADASLDSIKRRIRE